MHSRSKVSSLLTLGFGHLFEDAVEVAQHALSRKKRGRLLEIYVERFIALCENLGIFHAVCRDASVVKHLCGEELCKTRVRFLIKNHETNLVRITNLRVKEEVGGFGYLDSHDLLHDRVFGVNFEFLLVQDVALGVVVHILHHFANSQTLKQTKCKVHTDC